MSLAASNRSPILRVAMSRDDLMMRLGVVLFAVVLLVIVGLPLWSLLAKAFEDRDGKFVGLANYVSYFSTPALFDSEIMAPRPVAWSVPLGGNWSFGSCWYSLTIAPFQAPPAAVKSPVTR